MARVLARSPFPAPFIERMTWLGVDKVGEDLLAVQSWLGKLWS